MNDSDTLAAKSDSFLSLGVLPQLVTALEKLGINTPTAIQAAAIPVILEGKGAYVQAETGSGKTFAYLLPLFSKIDTKIAETQCIIVAPTYELAIQIQRQCVELSQHSTIPMRTVLLIGGTPKDRQLEKLKKKPHLVVGSSGRILELINAGKVKAHQVKTIVVDEADRLLLAESLTDIQNIFKVLPKTCQQILVSATQHEQAIVEIEALAPNLTAVKTGATLINPNIDHLYMRCEERDKPDVLRRMLHAFGPERALIFAHKNETAEIIASKLAHHKIAVGDIHGALRKEVRKKAMDDFRGGKTNVLIASDVAARGLDIKGVTHVFNCDVPSESSAYLHRVGRTARAGAKGIAVSLITEPDERLLKRFKSELGITMTEICLRNGEVYAANPKA